jgi:Cu/Ag efflux protein CusF
MVTGSQSATTDVDIDAKQRTSQQTTTSASASASAKLNAVVVSTDPTAKTITVKNPAKSTAAAGESQDSMTLPVEGKASAKLNDFKAGDRVSITCRETASSMGSSSAGSSSASASASGDTGWTMAKAGKCAAVTEIAKSKSTADEDQASSNKAKSKTGTEPQAPTEPRKY